MPPLLRALIFGATLAVAVGPIAVLIVQCGLTRGFGSAARCGLGAGLADLTYALIAFTAGPAISGLLAAHRRQVEIVASLVLVGFGLWMIWSALRARLRRYVTDPRWVLGLNVASGLGIVLFGVSGLV